MVKNKILEKRLATEKELSLFSEKEIFSFLFTPGFSTKTQVTDLSGRGVGLDSVKNVIDSLGGDIEIESQPGKGPKVVIELPLFK
jgi:two-component system chemotaxis sensor kinase CheA